MKLWQSCHQEHIRMKMKKSGGLKMLGLIKVRLALFDTALFKKMNILFEWIFWILKKWIHFFKIQNIHSKKLFFFFKIKNIYSNKIFLFFKKEAVSARASTGWWPPICGSVLFEQLLRLVIFYQIFCKFCICEEDVQKVSAIFKMI